MTFSPSAPASPEPAPVRNLLFDLDGTLTDPAVGILGSVGHALAGMGVPVPADLRWVIGPPLRGSFARLLDTDDRDTIERAMVLYRERFGTVGLFENEVYPDIPELLAAQRTAGRRLYVATSKPHVYARRIVEHFQLMPFFVELYGAELDGTRTGKAELLAFLLAQEELDASATVMIGDRRHDIEGARANGLRAIAVGYGYGTTEELGAAEPTWHCDTVAALSHWLKSLPR
jgi:phosphoglycolate phosphatase